jgi:rubredoxin
MHHFKSADAFLDHLRDSEFEALDHIGSSLTLALMDRLKAQDVRLNKWWVCTSTTWTCPCCDRDKAAIARLDSQGALCGELHSHYDHLGDYFREVVNSSEVIDPNEKALIIQRLCYALSLFPRTIICPDCNALEGQAKVLLKAESCFTFSPGEIQQFVVMQDNKVSLNEESLRRVFKQSQSDFLWRQGYGHHLIRLFHRHPNHAFHDWTEKAVSTRADTILRNYKIEGTPSTLHEMVSIMGERNQQKSSGDHWRREPLKINKQPITPQDKMELLSHETRSRHWRKVGEHWHCPLCERSKDGCLKWNKHGQLSFTVGKIEVYLNEQDTTTVEWQVCSDCQSHYRHLKQEWIDPDIHSTRYASTHFTAERLRASFIPVDHNRHQPDNEFIDCEFGRQ